MFYIEEERSIFKMPEEYYLAYTIAADFKCINGLPRDFNHKFGLKDTLKEKYPNYKETWQKRKEIYEENNKGKKDKKYGACILEGRVFNLIPKKYYYQRPTYGSLCASLNEMKTLAIFWGIKKIAVPRFGLGAEKLDWNRVKTIIKQVFVNTDIEICVCIYNKKTRNELKNELKIEGYKPKITVASDATPPQGSDFMDA